MITATLKITALVAMIIVVGMSIMLSISTFHTNPGVSGVGIAVALITAFSIGLITKE